MFSIDCVRRVFIYMTHIIEELEMPKCSTGPVELRGRNGRGVVLPAWLDDTGVEEDFYQLSDIFGYPNNVPSRGNWIREPRQVVRHSNVFDFGPKKVHPDKVLLDEAVFRERAVFRGVISK